MLMNVELSDLHRRFRAQPRLVRVFGYILAAVLVLHGLDAIIELSHGFSRGLVDGLNGAKFSP